MFVFAIDEKETFLSQKRETNSRDLFTKVPVSSIFKAEFNIKDFMSVLTIMDQMGCILIINFGSFSVNRSKENFLLI